MNANNNFLFYCVILLSKQSYYSCFLGLKGILSNSFCFAISFRPQLLHTEMSGRLYQHWQTPCSLHCNTWGNMYSQAFQLWKQCAFYKLCNFKLSFSNCTWCSLVYIWGLGVISKVMFFFFTNKQKKVVCIAHEAIS